MLSIFFLRTFAADFGVFVAFFECVIRILVNDLFFAQNTSFGILHKFSLAFFTMLVFPAFLIKIPPTFRRRYLAFLHSALCYNRPEEGEHR